MFSKRLLLSVGVALGSMTTQAYAGDREDIINRTVVDERIETVRCSADETATPERLTQIVQQCASENGSMKNDTSCSETQFKCLAIPPGQATNASPYGFSSHALDAGTTTVAVKLLGFTELNPLGAIGALGLQVGVDLTSSHLTADTCVEGKLASRIAGQAGGVSNLTGIVIYLTGAVIAPPAAIVVGAAAGIGTVVALWDGTKDAAIKDCYGSPVVVTFQIPKSVNLPSLMADMTIKEIVPQYSNCTLNSSPKNYSVLTLQLGERTLKAFPEWIATHPEFTHQYHMKEWKVSQIHSEDEYTFFSRDVAQKY